LNFVRFRLNAYPLLLDLYRLGFIDFKTPARDFLSRFSLTEGNIRLILAATFFPGSTVASKGHGSLADVLFDGGLNRGVILSLYQGLLTEVGDTIREGIAQTLKEDLYYYRYWWQLVPSSQVTA